MNRIGLYAGLLVVLLSGCASDPKPRPVTMPIEPLLGEFTVFKPFDTGYLESHSYGGTITIRKSKDGPGYRVSGDPDVAFLFDAKYGTLTPDLLDNDPQTAPYSVIKSIAWGSAGMSRPPSPYFAPVPIHAQAVVVAAQSFQVHYLVRGVGPAYWADVPVNFPKGVERVEDWDGNKWAYKRVVTSRGSRSERVRGELNWGGKPFESRARPGDILFTPIGKFMYLGEPDRLAYSSGWLDSTTYDHALFNDDGSLTPQGEMLRRALRESVGGDGVR